MEDDQNGRGPKWKRTKIKDDQNRRRPGWKIVKIKVKRKITTMEDN